VPNDGARYCSPSSRLPRWLWRNFHRPPARAKRVLSKSSWWKQRRWTPAAVAQWKKERFQAVAVVLDERTDKAAYRELARRISDGGLDLYCWIEVARNPKLATAHPRWMAALGFHQDWQKNFPKFPEPGIGEVAKAFPWVPIGYREAFDAHLARIELLIERAPPGWRGLLVNDLQAGPSSCGCGNLQCRWAIDYEVRPTATKLTGDDVATRFLTEVRKRTGDKTVIPVWTTECENVDLPAHKKSGPPRHWAVRDGRLRDGACPEVFTRQWTALTSSNDGPIGLLALHTALQRTQKEFGGGANWVTNAIAYLNQTLPVHGGKAILPGVFGWPWRVFARTKKPLLGNWRQRRAWER